MIKTALNCAGAIWLFVMLSPTGFSESAGGQAPPWLSPKQSVFAIEPAVIWEADVIGEPPSKRVRWKLGYGKTVIAEGKLELDSLDDPVQIRFLCPSELQQRATNFKLVFQWQAEDRELLASSLNQISFSLTLLPQNVTRVLGVPNHRPLVADSSDNLKKQLKRIGIDYRSVRLAHLHQTKTKQPRSILLFRR